MKYLLNWELIFEYNCGLFLRKMKKYMFTLCLCITAAFIPVILAKGQVSKLSQESEAEIKLSGLQMNVTSNVAENKEQILAGMKKASIEGSGFLVTPEGSLSGYMNSFDQNEVAMALKEIESTARQLNIGLMLGTCFKELINGKELCYNEVRVYTPEGTFLGEYSKILRCSNMDMPGTGEMNEYAEGQLKTFDWHGLRFGVLICNDLWATPGYTTTPNPYLVWKLKQMGAQFIVHCINSGTVQKYRPFHESSAELWAQSMNIPIFEVNAAQGNEKINAQSGLIDSEGQRILRVTDTGEQFFTSRIIIPKVKVDEKHK
jgi:predicted amidohydrolase